VETVLCKILRERNCTIIGLLKFETNKGHSVYSENNVLTEGNIFDLRYSYAYEVY